MSIGIADYIHVRLEGGAYQFRFYRPGHHYYITPPLSEEGLFLAELEEAIFRALPDASRLRILEGHMKLAKKQAETTGELNKPWTAASEEGEPYMGTPDEFSESSDAKRQFLT